jgi:3-oxoacyl-[acyl-carrier protein] reductase
MGFPRAANYASAKAGIIGLTRVVALEGAPFGILANAIAPGTVNTPMLGKFDSDLRRQFTEGIPLKREADPAEIASVAAFLASNDASYVTGQLIHVCGGSSIAGPSSVGLFEVATGSK